LARQGQAKQRMKQLKEGLRCLLRSLEIEPDNSEVQYHVNEVKAKLQKIKTEAYRKMAKYFY